MTIRELREEHGWSQAQLADRVGVSLKTVDHWERGLLQPDDEQLKVLGDVFHLPGEEIVLQDPIEQE
ncbi:helix-turn-helix transcriptional regulator [Nitrolancea hollandica]|uniref:Transcriptional regulator, XRE family n=1 Tax=Nitrolancea hollandica Lb TaxID=1129897 RepID=I4ECZ3_9BACT